MGYYTDYTLTICGCRDNDKKYDLSLSTRESLEAEIKLMNVFETGYLDDTYFVRDTWQDHNVDMRVLSSRFPNVLFNLHGEGDSPGDMWEKWYFNGASQYCPATISYDDFNPVKLGNSLPEEYVSIHKYTYQY